jgi:transposase
VEAIILDPIPGSAPCGLPACQRALFDARQQAGFYKALHHRATLREAALKERLARVTAEAQTAADARIAQREAELAQQLAELQAEVRLLKHRLYGRSHESHHHPNTLAHTPVEPVEDGQPDGGNDTGSGEATAAPPRPRGQQLGSPGHGRRDHQHLPATTETADLAPDSRCCESCGQPFAPCGSDPHQSTIIEVNVRAHRRVIRRRRYRPTCTCGSHPAVITAPPPPRLIPNSVLGVSVWVLVLLDKYAFYRPTYRLLAQLRLHGLDLAPGTLTDGLQRLLPLFEPFDEELLSHLREQQHWHGDETRWLVFASTEGKVGYQWWLWLVLSAEVAVFTLAAGRTHDVPEGVLGDDAKGIFNADRCTAYPAMKQVKSGQVTVALCWAHQRRDFIESERGRPELNAWAAAWLDRISTLYRLNEARLAVWQQEPLAFVAADQELRSAVAAMAQACAEEQEQESLAPACRKVLESMSTHWVGLTVFVEHPEVPMDNNAAERAERGPVVGRKNYYGSGAVWSGQLAARLFSLFETLKLWDINAQPWLTSYLTACADNGGRAPQDLRPWLPWRMTEAERAALKIVKQVGARSAQDSS